MQNILNAYWFEDPEQVRLIAEQWRMDYNHNHPHSSLKGISPINYHHQAIHKLNTNPRIADLNEKKLNLEWPDNW